MFDKLGMAEKTYQNKEQINKLVRRLESHPELLERFESILDLAESEGIGSFDEIERRLVDAVRQPGGETLEAWLARGERAVGESAKSEVAGTRQREKKR